MDTCIAGARYDQPTTWLVVFHRRCRTGWVDRLPMEFKHVSAIGHCPDAKVWIFYDVGIDRSRVLVAPDGPRADSLLSEWIDGAAVIAIDVDPDQSQSRRWRAGLWCVPAISHLIGIRSCALLPSTLFRQLIEAGGRIVADEDQDPGPGPVTGSDGAPIERERARLDPEGRVG